MDGTITCRRHETYPSHAAYLAAFIMAIVFDHCRAVADWIGRPDGVAGY
jgi:hypothetical protein